MAPKNIVVGRNSLESKDNPVSTNLALGGVKCQVLCRENSGLEGEKSVKNLDYHREGYGTPYG